MPEGNFGNEIDRSLALSSIRDTYGKSPDREVITVTRGLSPLFKSDLENEIFSDKTRAFDALSKNKAPGQISRPRLCAKLIQSSIDQVCMDRLEAARKNTDKTKFRFFFDFKAGMDLTLGSIPQAENQISGIAEEINSEVASRVSMPDKYASAYLALNKEVAKYSQLIRKDNTGFKLLDIVIREIKARGSTYIDPNWSKSYVVAGAETARDLYRKLYAIAEPLYPPKQELK
jgi:hypothetical protein